MTCSQVPNGSHAAPGVREAIFMAQLYMSDIARHSGDAVTEAMNAVTDAVGATGADPFVSLAARNTLESVEW